MSHSSLLFRQFFHPVQVLSTGELSGSDAKHRYPVGLHENLYSQINWPERECCNLSSSPSFFSRLYWMILFSILSVTYFLYEFYVRANKHVRVLRPWTGTSMTKEKYSKIQHQKMTVKMIYCN
jgi:hypothetical protein